MDASRLCTQCATSALYSPHSQCPTTPCQVENIFDGYNGTIFAYGQTGSGKSFTMEGVRGNVELQGLIPRMFDFLFELIRQSDSDLEFHIKCSYLEIYMEKIMDLLDAKKTNL